jgi:SRSO17 transposase
MFFNLKRKDLYAYRSIFRLIAMNFNDAFIARTRDNSGIARKYIQGLLLNRDRGNCSRFAKKIRKSSNQSLQHFITHSPWNERVVIDKIQKKVSKLIGNTFEGSLHIDETGFPKQGNHSVGVQRQYCGRLGKVENCQVGVVLGYSHKNQRILIDGQLYLPDEWAKSKELRNECEVPENVRFRTKAEIGLDMILNARKNGVPFGWIGMDCFYGEQPWLREKLDAEGLIFVADIPRDTRVWLSRPKIGIPERNGKQGRHPIRKKVLDGEPAPIEVQKIKDLIDPAQWRQVSARDTERKELVIDIACFRVYPVENKLPGKELWLIIRKEVGQDTIKYQLTNAAPDTDISRLAKMSCSRYWIERAIEDAKGVGSLEDYEARFWRSWHHHIAMSLLAMLAVLMMQIELKVKADMLTLQDVKDILEVIMPKREIGEKEIIKIIKAKHKARLSASESHHRRQAAISAG